jgi:hypothetical protein
MKPTNSKLKSQPIELLWLNYEKGGKDGLTAFYQGIELAFKSYQNLAIPETITICQG